MAGLPGQMWTNRAERGRASPAWTTTATATWTTCTAGTSWRCRRCPRAAERRGLPRRGPRPQRLRRARHDGRGPGGRAHRQHDRRGGHGLAGAPDAAAHRLGRESPRRSATWTCPSWPAPSATPRAMGAHVVNCSFQSLEQGDLAAALDAAVAVRRGRGLGRRATTTARPRSPSARTSSPSARPTSPTSSRYFSTRGDWVDLSAPGAGHHLHVPPAARAAGGQPRLPPAGLRHAERHVVLGAAGRGRGGAGRGAAARAGPAAAAGAGHAAAPARDRGRHRGAQHRHGLRHGAAERLPRADRPHRCRWPGGAGRARWARACRSRWRGRRASWRG